MIIFSKTNADGMDDFKNAIREKIIEMATRVIGPMWGDWDRFDKEIARKLNNGEIEYDEAIKKFVEDYYKWDFEKLTINGNTIIFRDKFTVEDTQCDGSYDLDTMVANLRGIYPDAEVFGLGTIDYGYSATSYILIASSDMIVFSDTENAGEDWIFTLTDFADGETVDDIAEYNEDFSLEKLREDMTKFLANHNLKLTVTELLDKLGLAAVKNLFVE